MKITVKSGGRGRPLVVDTTNLLSQLNKSLSGAKQTLSKIRKSTSGYRGVEILGTHTQLPDWLEETFQLLDMAKEGMKISYEQAKFLKSGIETTKQLASSRIATQNKALSKYFEQEFYSMIDNAMENQSSFTKEQFRSMERAFRQMTPQAKQEFMLSKAYQDIETLSKKYKKIKAWADKQTGKSLTYAEADAYLIKRRMQDGLSVDFMDKIVMPHK